MVLVLAAAAATAAAAVSTAQMMESAQQAMVETRTRSLAGSWIGTQRCHASLYSSPCLVEPELQQPLKLTANGSGVFQKDLVLRSDQVSQGERGDSFATGQMLGTSGKVHGTYMLQANATDLVGSWISWSGSERVFVWNMKRAQPVPQFCPCGHNTTAGSCLTCKPGPPVKLSPLYTVFENPHYPECCTVAMDPSEVCFYRIPVVLSVPETAVVLAFAEARLGAVSGRGCGDGSGPALAMKRSTNGGISWSKTHWIANDTEPLHVQLKDGIVLGVSLYDLSSKTAFLFYTACYQRCVYTTAHVLQSTDQGQSWSKPADGNLTDMLLQQNISMMQWGEGQGLVLPNGDLLACGWYKVSGRGRGEADASDSVACVSSNDNGRSWSLRGRLPTPHPPTNEVAAALTPDGSIYLSMRTNSKMPQRMQSWSTDDGHTFSAIDQGPLPAPHCNAGAVNPTSKHERLLLAHIEPDPNCTVDCVGRRNMVLRTSVDGGESFTAAVQLNHGLPAGYITLTTTNDGRTVGGLYENANAVDLATNPNATCYSRISYQNITLHE